VRGNNVSGESDQGFVGHIYSISDVSLYPLRRRSLLKHSTRGVRFGAVGNFLPDRGYLWAGNATEAMVPRGEIVHQLEDDAWGRQFFGRDLNGSTLFREKRIDDLVEEHGDTLMQPYGIPLPSNVSEEGGAASSAVKS
jgi:hypothetical protein